jgi:hypothetical protein
MRSRGPEFFHAGGRTDLRTDGQTDTTKLTVVFRSFEYAPKNSHKSWERSIIYYLTSSATENIPPNMPNIFCLLVFFMRKTKHRLKLVGPNNDELKYKSIKYIINLRQGQGRSLRPWIHISPGEQLTSYTTDTEPRLRFYGVTPPFQLFSCHNS